MKALVEFQDGCYGAYQDQVYFLAAESLLEFKECNLTDKIVEQLVEYGFGDYDMSAAIEKRSNRRSQDNSGAYSTVYHRYFDTIEVQAIKLLKIVNRKSVIYSLTDFMVNNKNDFSTKAAQRFLTNL